MNEFNIVHCSIYATYIVTLELFTYCIT